MKKNMCNVCGKTFIVCNVCGKTFNFWDAQESFGLHYSVGYGSKFDGDTVNCDLCCNCFDRLMTEYIIPKSIHNPVESGDEGYDEERQNKLLDEYLKGVGEGEWTGESEDISR